MKVVIMSGVPGSGKSTYARKLVQSAGMDKEVPIPLGVIVSADDYFLKDGKYIFDRNKLSDAHSWCLRRFVDAIAEGKPLGDIGPKDWFKGVVVVDNTNTTGEEIAPYYQLARAFGCEVELVTVYRDIMACAEKNVHGSDLRHATTFVQALAPSALDDEKDGGGNAESVRE